MDKGTFTKLTDKICSIAGKQFKGLIFASKDSLGVNYYKFTSSELQEIEVLAKKVNPDWIVSQQTKPSWGYDNPVTWIGPPRGLDEDGVFDKLSS